MGETDAENQIAGAVARNKPLHRNESRCMAKVVIKSAVGKDRIYNMPDFVEGFSDFLREFFGSPFVENGSFQCGRVENAERRIRQNDAKYYDLRLWNLPMMQTNSGDVQ